MLSNAPFPSSLSELIHIIELLNESIHNCRQIYCPNHQRLRVRCYWSCRASNCISCSSGDCKIIILFFLLEGIKRGGSLKSFQIDICSKLWCTALWLMLYRLSNLDYSFLFCFWCYFNFKMVCVFRLILECFSRPTCFWVYYAATSLQYSLYILYYSFGAIYLTC